MSTSTTDETTTSPTATTRRFPWWVRVLFTMIAMHVSMIPTLAVALVLQMTTASLDPTLQDWLGEIPSLLMPVGTLALLWVFMKYIDRRPMREAGLFVDRRTLPTFLLGFVLLTGLALTGDAALLAGTAAVGSYTTFSTWMLESQRLTEERQVRSASLNIVVSLVLGVAAAAIGQAIGTAIR